MKRIVAISILFISLLLVLTGCQITGCSYIDYQYDNANKYEKGGTTINKTVNELEIDWLTGEVFVEYHDGEEIIFNESASQTLEDDNTLRYYLEGTTLHIKYAKNGRLPLGIGNVEKTLVVKLPKNINLNSAEIETISADISVTGKQSSISDFEIDSISGEISLDIENTNNIEINSTSGKIDIKANVIKQTEINSVSGDIKISTTRLEGCDISTTSADVDMRLTEHDFIIEHSLTSGRYYCEFMPSIQGSTLAYGDALYEYEISSTSGDLTIMSK